MRYIIVAGYGWSGSSVVVDLLREYSNTAVPNAEFRLIKDPLGLADLRRNVVTHWDALNSDIAVCGFRWVCQHMNHIDDHFSAVAGLSYERLFGPAFIKETERFLGEIVDFDYTSDWIMKSYGLNRYQYFKKKVLRKLGLLHPGRMHFSWCTPERFDAAAMRYIDALMHALIGGDNKEFVVLDQAIPAQRPQDAQHYFSDYKMIVVDRDPRDIYVDLANGKNLIGNELYLHDDPDKYLAWHRAFRRDREASFNNESVLLLRFEDLVLNYDTAVDQVEKFLGLDPAEHIESKKYFDPAVSCKNIGVWKSYRDQDVMEKLRSELREDCYEP